MHAKANTDYTQCVNVCGVCAVCGLYVSNLMKWLFVQDEPASCQMTILISSYNRKITHVLQHFQIVSITVYDNVNLCHFFVSYIPGCCKHKLNLAVIDQDTEYAVTVTTYSIIYFKFML